jgi:MFS family permease
VTLVANVAAVVTIPLFGALSDRIGRRMLMVAGGIGGGLLAGGYLWAIDQRSLVLVFVCVVLVQGIKSRSDFIRKSRQDLSRCWFSSV